MNAQPHPSADPDLLCEMSRRLRDALPTLDPRVLQTVEAGMRQDYGGRRHFLRKGVYTKLSDGERLAVFQDGVSTMSDEAIMLKHGISRSTLYRLMKMTPANS